MSYVDALAETYRGLMNIGKRELARKVLIEYLKIVIYINRTEQETMRWLEERGLI